MTLNVTNRNYAGTQQTNRIQIDQDTLPNVFNPTSVLAPTPQDRTLHERGSPLTVVDALRIVRVLIEVHL